MGEAVRATVCFLADFLYDKIPRRKVDLFAEALANSLARTTQSKMASNESFILPITGNDQLEDLKRSAEEVNLEPAEILQYFPEMALIMKPGEIQCQCKPEVTLRSVYKKEKGAETNPELFNRLMTTDTKTPDAPTFELIFPDDKKFTAESFSKTRFGSTRRKDEDGPRRSNFPHIDIVSHNSRRSQRGFFGKPFSNQSRHN